MTSMEFWGIEVKAGKPFKVSPGESWFIHLSQASLGESKNKANEPVHIYVKVDKEKLVLGTLSQQNFPQISFDLVFEKEFELSHNWKNGSVYFCGYKSQFPDEGEEDSDMFESEEESEGEEIPVAAENGKPKVDENAKQVKTEAVKQKTAEPSKDDEDESDGSESEDEDGSDSEEDEMSMDEDGSSGEEDEETPKKPEVSKKRANESATKTPVAKKAKSDTPQKTDGKKAAHTATPHPSKQGKTPAKSPKSGGQFACGSCSKSFNSEGGLQAHSKAKHGAQ